jgi:hypothetical protein
MGRHIIYKCPQTGLNVQHWLEDVLEDSAGDDYEPVNCPACTLAHFIHRDSGKLLGED